MHARQHRRLFPITNFSLLPGAAGCCCLVRRVVLTRGRRCPSHGSFWGESYDEVMARRKATTEVYIELFCRGGIHHGAWMFK
jgi:hypothetical protein